MYTFADFETVKELPDVLNVKMLADAIGLSISRTYEIIDERKIPYLAIGKRKIIFKKHLLQRLSSSIILSSMAEVEPIKSLPKVFNPKRLTEALGISNGNAYVLVRTPGVPAVLERNRIIISKAGLIDWITKNEKNTLL